MLKSLASFLCCQRYLNCMINNDLTLLTNCNSGGRRKLQHKFVVRFHRSSVKFVLILSVPFHTENYVWHGLVLTY